MRPDYYLKDGEFVIEGYNNAKPFASFLPGIAGFYGKPLWAFYVNRGQCVASFGMNSKDGAIMEFHPATTAYRRVTLEGFRTFLRWHDRAGEHVYEPFKIPGTAAAASAPEQVLSIAPHELRVRDSSRRYGWESDVTYFTVPGEDFPALARVLRIRNLSASPRQVEVVDGMPKVCCYGLHEWFMKHMSRTIEAWMTCSGVADKKPFYRLRVDAADVAETKYITSGNFYLSVLSAGQRRSRPEIIVDPRIVFGAYSDMTEAGGLLGGGLRLPARQIDKNIAPSAFSHFTETVPANGEIVLSSLIGHADSVAHLDAIDGRLDTRFFTAKRAENASETGRIASTFSLFSASRELDGYMRQTNLDNILRGGLPVTLAGGDKVAYVYNRKHGDLERDYNQFVVQAEYFAQGNGNYRDANQNRRLSVWLNPAVGTKDIRDFYDLMQLDGYNPLVIKGDRFTVRRAADRRRLARAFFPKKDSARAEEFLAGEFTIGQLMAFSPSFRSPGGAGRRDRLLAAVMKAASMSIQADHGEGYWIDHWTYNLDLVESYLSLFPEKKEELLFRDTGYRFFDNDHVVKPRAEKVTRDSRGRIRQYGAVEVDEEKRRLLGSRVSDRTWVRTRYGKGTVYTCSLAAKMLILIANKIATLDAEGAGIEMEADKPGWCDSLNGLPGLFGSSSCETFELARLVRFLIGAVTADDAKKLSVRLPVEAAAFIRGLLPLLGKGPSSDHAYWERSNALKERYRATVRFGVSGKETALDRDAVLTFLLASARKLTAALGRLYGADGIPFTYFTHEAAAVDRKNRIGRFEAKPLPIFLEGVVHALKVQEDRAAARALCERVRKSDLYDSALGMYRLNASLERESLEVGRSRVFTPGWLENESVWLHMEYKYLLEELKCGLYDEFFADFTKALIPFQDAVRYGRSILENSSFIASSRFFDADLAGTGFYARLSGATVEFLHMIQIMNLGQQPFAIEEGKLVFRPRPVLKRDLFADEARTVEFTFRNGSRRVVLPRGSYAFSLFATTLVVYENPRARDTFGRDSVRPSRFVVRYANGKERSVEGASLGEPFSKDLRAGLIAQITVLLD